MSDKFKCKTKSKQSIEDTVPTFIRKTYEILEEKKYPEIIDWNDEGTALVIKAPSEFCQKVLPLYFKHNNLTSFIRQLNMYNFHKRRTQDVDHVYCHELFQRGKKLLLKDIKRKNNEHFLSMQKSVDVLESIQNAHDSPNLLHENQILKKMNKEFSVRVDSMEKRLREVTSQNQTLLSQARGLNEREEILKYILTMLMKQFRISSCDLPSLMKNYPPLSTQSHTNDFKSLRNEFLLKECCSSSQNQTNNYSLNSQDYLYSLPNYSSFLETSSTETSGDELRPASQKTEPKEEANTNNEPYNNNKFLNYESTLFKDFASGEVKGTNMIFDSLENKVSGLFCKRHIETNDAESVALRIIKRETSDGKGASIFVKRIISNLDDDLPKPNEFGQFRANEFDLNTSIDLMNFNLN